LDKRVPTGAGLGGGSSNAATALWAANQFNGCPATEKELQEWSSEIGSDVPFFFSQGAAYCTGRGEVSSNTRYHPFFKSDWRNIIRCLHITHCHI
jgi:4-diphosphocytidyl-2-C-methyl-D-erythritol kinase